MYKYEMQAFDANSKPIMRPTNFYCREIVYGALNRKRNYIEKATSITFYIFPLSPSLGEEEAKYLNAKIFKHSNVEIEPGALMCNENTQED